MSSSTTTEDVKPSFTQHVEEEELGVLVRCTHLNGGSRE
jgi:hypothetical protein